MVTRLHTNDRHAGICGLSVIGRAKFINAVFPRSVQQLHLDSRGVRMSVNKPLPHDAAKLHVSGSARYIDDLPVPDDCLHLCFGTSTIARGSIQEMD